MPAKFQPNAGETVVVKISKGARVRDPVSRLPLETGDVVTWSTFFQRRELEGALEASPYKPTKERADASLEES